MNTTAIITAHIRDEYLPDVSPADLDAEYDLLANGVIDSLGLLRLIGWIQDRFIVDVDDRHISPEMFRSVSAIRNFVDGNREKVERDSPAT